MPLSARWDRTAARAAGALPGGGRVAVPERFRAGRRCWSKSRAGHDLGFGGGPSEGFGLGRGDDGEVGCFEGCGHIIDMTDEANALFEVCGFDLVFEAALVSIAALVVAA